MVIATGYTRHAILASGVDLEKVDSAQRCRSLLEDANAGVAEVAALARLYPLKDGTRHASVLVGSRSHRSQTNAKGGGPSRDVILWSGHVPGESLWRVATGPDSPVPELYITSPELECAVRGRQLSVAELALLMTVQCGTFRYTNAGVVYQKDTFTSVEKLSQFSDDLGKGWYGHTKFLQAASLALEGCASVPEAKTSELFSLPAELGGRDLGRPGINVEVEIPEWLKPLVESRESFIYDQEWSADTALEYDGRIHEESEAAILDDKEKILASIGMGRVVLPVTRRTMETYGRFEVLGDILERRLTGQVKPPSSSVEAAREALFNTFKVWDPIC